jgi:hypothetical protein
MPVPIVEDLRGLSGGVLFFDVGSRIILIREEFNRLI